jgi:hypothetical protein
LGVQQTGAIIIQRMEPWNPSILLAAGHVPLRRIDGTNKVG